LLSQADDNIMAQLLDNEDELNARIFTFPTSAIRQDGQKLNYYDFLTSTDIKECHDALQRIVPRIDLEKINDFIDRLMELRQFKTSFTSTILKHAMIKFYFLLTRYL